jgi:SAM-dependent methyltransferase
MAVESDVGALPSETRTVGAEAGKTIARKIEDGFVGRYLSGAAILDVGYRGYTGAQPILSQAIGIELDYPGYDGRTLPFADQTQDAVFASHCLEHIEDYRNAIREWHRVLKIGGYMVIAVPHKFLYEKRTELPSRWNEDHKRFYTPASLMAEIEASLSPNTYRLRHLIDNDLDYDYAITPSRHAGGCYEIELVLERLAPPAWDLEDPPPPLTPPPPPALDTPEPRGSGRVSAVVLALWRTIPEPLKLLVPRSWRSAAGAVLWRRVCAGTPGRPSVPPTAGP